MHEIRQSLRGEGVVLMGKNTMVRRAVRGFLSEFPEYGNLLPHVKGNVGFVFTNGDLKEIRDKILANKVAAPARAGAVAPADVYVPAGNTGMEPGKTSFFQALGVPTKIARGTIEITIDLKLVEANTKVGASEATLLNMLNISPFTYGMGISQVYDDGQVFPPFVLDIEEKQLLDVFASAINTIATISLAVNYPTLPSVIHSVINSYKKVISVALATEYSYPAIEELKDRIANPDAYASAAPVAAAAPTAAATKAEEKKEESEKEESDEEGMFKSGQLPFVPPLTCIQVDSEIFLVKLMFILPNFLGNSISSFHISLLDRSSECLGIKKNVDTQNRVHRSNLYSLIGRHFNKQGFPELSQDFSTKG